MNASPGPRGHVVQQAAADLLGWLWRSIRQAGTIRAGGRQADRFARFGAGTTVAFPPALLHGTHRVELGSDTTIGPQATLSVGMPVPLDDRRDPVITVGDRCLLGRGITIIAHERVEIGDDTFAGHAVYITDQNHGYEDPALPIGQQLWRNAPVRIGADCWLGHGATILPGTTIGRHVVVAAGAVVTGSIPDYCVVAGVPARIVRRYLPDSGWVRTDPDGTPRSA